MGIERKYDMPRPADSYVITGSMPDITVNEGTVDDLDVWITQSPKLNNDKVLVTGRCELEDLIAVLTEILGGME